MDSTFARNLLIVGVIQICAILAHICDLVVNGENSKYYSKSFKNSIFTSAMEAASIVLVYLTVDFLFKTAMPLVYRALILGVVIVLAVKMVKMEL